MSARLHLFQFRTLEGSRSERNRSEATFASCPIPPSSCSATSPALVVEAPQQASRFQEIIYPMPSAYHHFLTQDSSWTSSSALLPSTYFRHAADQPSSSQMRPSSNNDEFAIEPIWTY